MNADDALEQTLNSLGKPLPPERSLVSGVLSRLDAPLPTTISTRTAFDAPKRSNRIRFFHVGLAIAGLVTVLLLFVFSTKTPPLTLAEVMAAVDQQHWAQLVFEDGSETWVCLDDGKFLMKHVESKAPTYYYLRDPATRTEQRCDGLSEIRLSRPEAWVLGINRNGKTIPLEVHELTFSDLDLSRPEHTSDAERNLRQAVRDYDIVTEDGRRLGHFSHYSRDALGDLQLTKELWVDLETKLPVRIRSWRFAQETAMRVPHDGIYHFVNAGPRDLYDLGVPRTVRIVPQISTAAEAQRLVPLDTLKAIAGAKAAVRNFPHKYRVVTLDDTCRLSITYVDSGDAQPFEWAAPENEQRSIGRYFFADCQNTEETAPGLAALIEKAFRDISIPVPADLIAKEFPLQKSVNTQLVDGRRWFVLTRSSLDPPKSRLQVLTAAGSNDAREIENQWHFAHWNWTELATGTSAEIAPAGQILVHAERGDLKNDWFVDPLRDYTVARHLESRLVDSEWRVRETRAVQWEHLPDGPWYVSAWETRRRAMVQRGDGKGGTVRQEEEVIDLDRVVLTRLANEDFPTDIFNGDKFLEAAKAAGAQIRVD